MYIYLSMYIHIYIHMFICIHMHIYTYIFENIYVYTNIYMFTRIFSLASATSLHGVSPFLSLFLLTSVKIYQGGKPVPSNLSTWKPSRKSCMKSFAAVASGLIKQIKASFTNSSYVEWLFVDSHWERSQDGLTSMSVERTSPKSSPRHVLWTSIVVTTLNLVQLTTPRFLSMFEKYAQRQTYTTGHVLLTRYLMRFHFMHVSTSDSCTNNFTYKSLHWCMDKYVYCNGC